MAVSQKIQQPSVTKISLKITYLKCHSNFLGANELKCFANYTFNITASSPRDHWVKPIFLHVFQTKAVWLYVLTTCSVFRSWVPSNSWRCSSLCSVSSKTQVRCHRSSSMTSVHVRDTYSSQNFCSGKWAVFVMERIVKNAVRIYWYHQCVSTHSRWIRSWRCSCLVTWFCYQLIAKPGNKTAASPWPDPDHSQSTFNTCCTELFIINPLHIVKLLMHDSKVKAYLYLSAGLQY